MNLHAALRRTDGSRVFLRLPDGRALTYGDVDDRAAAMAGALRDLGVGAGDRVVAQVDKSPDNIALYLACLRLGAVYVPLNTAYTAAEVTSFVADAEPAVVVARPGTLRDRGELAAGVVELGTTGDGTFAAAADAAAPFDDVVERSPGDAAAMLFTSGTTGRSKGVVLSHGSLASNAGALHAVWRFGPDDVLLHALPIFHVHGLFVALHCAMLAGAEVLLLPVFDVPTVLDLLPQATVLMGVPTHYTRLLGDQRFSAESCRSLRLLTSGSAPMTATLHTAIAARVDHAVVERYGMTEAGIITSNPYDGERRPGTVGFALPGVEVRVADEQGRSLPVGTSGVVEVRGPGLFSGYWRLPDATRAAHHPGGWFITGDIGSIDDDGRLTLEGRVSDLIITGGYNVSPIEVELVLDAVPGVRESAVVGVPHPDFGEAVVAVVVRDDGAAATDAALAAALQGVLARFKHPKRYVDAPALPRNAMGKVEKSALRDQLRGLFDR